MRSRPIGKKKKLLCECALIIETWWPCKYRDIGNLGVFSIQYSGRQGETGKERNRFAIAQGTNVQCSATGDEYE
jgi:hypothetical protein